MDVIGEKVEKGLLGGCKESEIKDEEICNKIMRYISTINIREVAGNEIENFHQ